MSVMSLRASSRRPPVTAVPQTVSPLRASTPSTSPEAKGMTASWPSTAGLAPPSSPGPPTPCTCQSVPPVARVERIGGVVALHHDHPPVGHRRRGADRRLERLLPDASRRSRGSSAQTSPKPVVTKSTPPASAMPPPGPESGTAPSGTRLRRPGELPVAGHRRQLPGGVDGEDEPAGDDRPGEQPPPLGVARADVRPTRRAAAPAAAPG